MFGLVDYDLTMSCTNFDYSLKGSQALFDLLLTPYDDSIPTQYNFLSPLHSSSKLRWYWLLAHSVSLLNKFNA
jgi:hypothetical protein